MALKDTWKDKVNGEDDVDAKDINDVAKAVIAIEDELDGKMDSAKTMDSITEIDLSDFFIIYDLPDGSHAKISWQSLRGIIQNWLDKKLTAVGVTDTAGTGYTATLPELEEDAVLALSSDIAKALVGYATEKYVQYYAQQKGNYQPAGDYALVSQIPTKPADIGAQPAGNYVSASQTITITGVDENGVTHTWTVYGV